MITPAETPVVCPENAALVDAVRGVRYDLANLADRIGDLERTIRLHAVGVGNGHKDSIANLLHEGAVAVLAREQQVRDTKQGE